MNDKTKGGKVVAAVTTAITAYLEQEQLARLTVSSPQSGSVISPWRLYGRQELMRARTHWRQKIHR